MVQEKHKILIFEDEAPIRELLKMELENEVFIVEVSENGLEALEKIKTFLPDLIVFDVIMLVKDRFTLSRKIKQRSN